MSSLKYLGGASLVLLLSSPISAHFQHMNIYKDIVTEPSTSPIKRGKNGAWNTQILITFF